MTIEFVDGIADVVVVGPTARIDFFVLRPDPSGKTIGGGRPDLVKVPALTIAIPLDGFANAVSILDQVRAGLMESGILKVRQAEEAEEPLPAVSPNFTKHN